MIHLMQIITIHSSLSLLGVQNCAVNFSDFSPKAHLANATLNGSNDRVRLLRSVH